MNEFISILISFIFMSLADSVDSFFNNSISISAIVVCGSLFSINLIARSIGEIGIYTYRVIRKKEISYLLMTGIISFIIGIIIFLTKDLLVNLFYINSSQSKLLSLILSLYVLYLPSTLLNNGLLEIVRLKGNLKLYRKGLIIYYILLILFDSLAFYFTNNLVLLFVATICASTFSFIYLLINSKFKYEKISKEEINNIKKFGITLSGERLLSRIFILIYCVLASNLGENNYAIHSICYAVCINLEIITNAYSATLMIKIPEGKTKESQFKLLNIYMKKCFIVILLFNFGLSLITLILQHGSLPIMECFPYIIFYSLTVFGLYLYESYKAMCVIQGKPKILLVGSTIGVIVRVLICFIFMKTPICLYIFGIANFIDFFTRGLYYKYKIDD